MNFSYTTTEINQLIDKIFDDVPGRKNYPGFPFVDVLYDDKNSETIIDVAVAGYGKDDLNVSTLKDSLIIKGKIEGNKIEEGVSYREQNIKKSNFERVFTLKKGAYVTSVVLENGILEVRLGYEVPEEERPSEYVIHQE